MTPEPVILRPDATVAEALARIRNPDIPPALASRCSSAARRPRPRPGATSAACTPSGCCASRRSSWSPACCDTELETLRPDALLAGDHPLLRDLQPGGGPGRRHAEHLLGAVTVDDVLDHLLPADWRDRFADEHDNPADHATVRMAPTEAADA